MKTHKVYLVGAGPGRPDLITVRGLNILRETDVVIYDYLVDKRLFDEVKEGAELICCDQLGKSRYSDGFLKAQDNINNLMIRKAKEGKKVIRLKNGDPSIFGRFSQELKTLVKNKIEFEVVPGVTAASAASCLGGIPLTDRRFASSCVFVTGHEDPKKRISLIDWGSLAKSGTIILYMAVENLENIVEKVLKAGKDKDTPVAIVQDASLPTQKVFTGILRDIVAKAKREKIKPPAIVIIGEVAELEKKFNWLKRNKRILFTGLSKERFFTKDIYFHLPLIKIEPMKDYEEFDNYLKNIKDFNWIVFEAAMG
ncbi:uroporphyrinogen-III C-methyltransferase [bacterium]|nr:uroporphyrinogen-III C-methyltransferase [bacterium]